jgi:hypothetical protein
MPSGFENRYANDYGGNHVQRIKDQNDSKKTYFVSYKTRTCTTCFMKKPVKGGTGIGKKFKCAECSIN